MSETQPARKPRGCAPSHPPRGDEAALFSEHQRFLVRVTTRALGGSQELAEDACAFAWLALVEHQPERQATIAWLRVVARHEGLRLLSRQRREPFLEDRPHQRRDSASGKPLHWSELLPAPVDTDLAVEARQLMQAVSELRWHQRTVLTLQLAGYRYKEIAQRLGKTYTWVNRHLTEGRAELRRRRVAELAAAGFRLDDIAELLGVTAAEAGRQSPVK